MRELSVGGACVGLEVLWKDNKGYVLYWTVVCYHPYIVSPLQFKILAPFQQLRC